MEENRRRNYGCPNNCSQDGTDQKCFGYCGGIKSRARSNRYRSKRSLPSSTIINPVTATSPSIAMDASTPTPNDNNESNGLKNGLVIAGIVIGALTLLIIIIYGLFRLMKKSKDPQEEEELPIPNKRDLTLTFVRHNHAIPELCTTPDTQPIIDYYSSKAGLINVPSFPVVDQNDLNVPTDKNPNENPEENTNHEYVPQYYNGMEIPPLGARIIPLERQIQIAKELASANLSPTNHKRKSNRSISSILSISSRRKSSTSNVTINSNSNNNSNNGNSTTTLTLIRETPRSENDTNIVS